MTTPAIDQNQYAMMATRDYTINNGVQTSSNSGTALGRWRAETRPASVNNALRYGWRQPSGWSHTLIEASPAPPGLTIWVQDDRSPKPEVDGSYYVDGRCWDNKLGSLSSFDGQLTNRAVIQALQNLKNQRVNLAQAFAEREQVVRMFSNAADRIANSVRVWRARNPRKLWDSIVRNEGHGGYIPRSWLELQYGWKPLMSDISGSYESLRETEGNGRSYRITVKGKASRKLRTSYNKPARIYGDLVFARMSGVEVQAAKVRLDYYLENPLLASLSQLGVTNPAVLAWELLPYSFVVDWFLPIGNALSVMDAALGYSFLGGTSTEYRRLDESGFCGGGSSTVPGNPHLTVHKLGSATVYNRRMAMRRNVYSSSPLPRFPGFKNPLSSGHVANAMALLVSAFSGNPSRGR